MNVSLTEKQQKYISDQIKSGDFQNASELVRDALRLHQYYREQVIRELRVSIEQGWEGSTSAKSIRQIVNEKKADYNG